jgi:uncharacterized protein YjbI with pentapeptide repeats
MANEEHLALLRQGVEVWNKWRSRAEDITPNLSGVVLSGAILSRANLFDTNLSGAVLSGVFLSEADLSGATLNGAILSGAILNGASLLQADLSGAVLIEASLIEAVLSGANLSKAILRRANLNGASLAKANLTYSDLSGADLSGARCVEADLSRAVLSRTQALGTNFMNSVFTGTCLEDWNINNETILDYIDCQYIYLKPLQQERRPSAGEFAPGEFTKLFQKALSTVDLIFRNGVDWEALLISLEKLRVEAEGAELSIQAIENKNDGAFVVRVSVPPEANKAEVEKFLKREYELALKSIDEQYQFQLRLQGERLEEYREHVTVQRQENTDLRRIIEKMADKESSKIQQNFYAQVNSVTGNVEGSQNIYISQSLSEAAEEIQKLLLRLQTQGKTEEAAQQEVATEMAKQAESDPTAMGKLVQWGKSMANKAGETTVSEATKTVLTIALKMAGIPLP